MSILPLILFLLALALSLVIIQVGTMALMLTGLSREIARFQSHSAFTGVGFTTEEAEAVVNHPVRRHICMALMILGKLGVASLMATLLVTVMRTEASSGDNWMLPLLLLIGGLGTLWVLAVSPWVERQLNKPIAFALKRFSTLNVTDYVALLQLEGDFTVSELSVRPADWISDKTLVELALAREGLLVLGIRRESGAYIGAPSGETRIEAGDTVVLYGPAGRIEELDKRRTGRQGDIAHDEAKKAYDSYLVEVVPPSPQLDQQPTDVDHT
ncbi:MAG: TrkA C-terminal domain-containing protein [Planctomycetota bacterium]